MNSKLCERFGIGQLDLKNRMVMSPMLTKYGDPEGNVTERLKKYYETRARGGVGLIIVESSYVHKEGQHFNCALGVSHDNFIPGLSELVQAVHRHGTKIAIQLVHGGKASLTNPVVPSPLASLGARPYKVASLAEIKQITFVFAQAALRAKKAGFDGVEIHAAHGYLFAQFLSRSTNKRQDAYGGQLQNRARFLCDTIKAIRQEVGNDYPVWCRLNGKEYGVVDGITLGEAQKTAKLCQAAGADAIHVSCYTPESPLNDPIFCKVVESFYSSLPPVFRPAIITGLAAGIKKAVHIPVIAVGRMTPEAGEKVLAEGKADLIAFGKSLLADPELPNKVSSGRIDDIKPCILCLSCRNDAASPEVLGIRCRVNPELGRETEYEKLRLSKTTTKKVIVIGGGPGGMEAARVAASRGHRVILFEKRKELGGLLNQAAVPPYKDGIKLLNEYLQKQLQKLKVGLNLGTEIKPDELKELKPDEVIVAVGTTQRSLNIPGINQENVVTALEVLAGKKSVGKNVIIVGGGQTGCETAEYLAIHGRKVIILEMLAELGVDVLPVVRPFFLKRLEKAGIEFSVKSRVVEITKTGVLAIQDGIRRFLEGDTVVLAVGLEPQNSLAQELLPKFPSVHQIGDCVKPRTIAEAVKEGYDISLSL